MHLASSVQTKQPGLRRHVLQGNLKTEQIILHKKCGPIKHLCCAVALILVAEVQKWSDKLLKSISFWLGQSW